MREKIRPGTCRHLRLTSGRRRRRRRKKKKKKRRREKRNQETQTFFWAVKKEIVQKDASWSGKNASFRESRRVFFKFEEGLLCRKWRRGGKWDHSSTAACVIVYFW